MSKIKISKKFLGQNFALSLVIGMIIWLVVSNSKVGKSPLIIVNFLIIALISTYSIIKDRRILSVNKVIWYFCLIFMSIAPLCQYVSSYYPWRFVTLESEIEIAQWLTMLFYLVYLFFYNHILKKVRIKRRNQESRLTRYLCEGREYSANVQMVLLVSVVLAFVVLIRLNGFENLFIKSENNVAIENSTMRFVVKKFLSAFPAMACTIFIIDKKGSVSQIAVIFTLIITLLSNFPTSTSRYWMGTILLGVILNKFMERVESRKYDYAILLIVLVLFPFFFIFKSRTLADILGGGYTYGGIINSFNSVDFDAFSLLARSVRYVSENGIAWGKQLLNIIFFFIPRSIWSEKPRVTGPLIASSQNASYTNLSCPLPGEGYVNFGVVGVILFAVILAVYSYYLDKVYWETGADRKNNLITMLYPYLAIIMLYISRGSLQPTFIQTIALILPMIVISMVFPNKKEETSIRERI